MGQILNIDFELIKSLYDNTKKEDSENNDIIEPMEYMDKNKLYDDYKHYENIGKHAIESKKLAAVTMAGGQGTRLGHNGPKGTYDIGLDSHKSLFELLSDSLKRSRKKIYGVTIPWFIMTSRENNQETVEFFKKISFLVTKKIKIYSFSFKVNYQ